MFLNFLSVLDVDKRVLVSTHNKYLRSCEELQILIKDMESYLKFYSEKSNRLKSEIDAFEIFEEDNISSCEVKMKLIEYV